MKTNADAQDRVSLEDLREQELKTLEEFPLTRDAQGQVRLEKDVEDEYDTEYPDRDRGSAPEDDTAFEIRPRVRPDDPRVIKALRMLPARERSIFLLYLVLGLSAEVAADITEERPEDVIVIARRVQQHVYEQLGTEPP